MEQAEPSVHASVFWGLVVSVCVVAKQSCCSDACISKHILRLALSFQSSGDVRGGSRKQGRAWPLLR